MPAIFVGFFFLRDSFMSDFQIGQIFENEYPTKAATFANANNCSIENFEKVERTVDRIESRPGEQTGIFVVFTDGTEKSIVPDELKIYVKGSKHMMPRLKIVKKPEPTTEEVAAGVRARRDALIAQTDYLMMSDYPISAEDKTLLETYRQALRDIPEQEGFPSNVQWPVAPQCVK